MAQAQPLTPGEVIRIEMPPYHLGAGRGRHRIRIAIAGHDASAFARYPEDGAPILTVIHSPASPSIVELPVATD